ncbi:hypothetical protein RsTz2092_05830 [Deferribacterales bacterium RsTz2092]|nr:hypothetical protein AGMMS49941_12540 [Deferribacterales bacterium]
MTTRTIKLLFSLFFLLILLVSYLFMRILTADYARGQVGLFLYEAGVSEDNFSYSGAYANVLTGKLYLSNIKYGNSLFIGKLAVGGYKKLGNGNVVADVSASGVRYKDDNQSVSVGSFSVDDIVFSQAAFVRGDYKRVIAGVDEVSVKDVAVVPNILNIHGEPVNITGKRARVTNMSTDANMKEVDKILKENGYTVDPKGGKYSAVQYSKVGEEKSFSVRNSADSIERPTVDVVVNHKLIMKIRLKP